MDIYKILKDKSIPQDPIKKEIKDLKSKLEENDYKIIKCMEYQLINKKLPYNIEELHKEREIIRKRINELEIKENNEEGIL